MTISDTSCPAWRQAATHAGRRFGRAAGLAALLTASGLFALPSQGSVMTFQTTAPQSMWGTGGAAILDESIFIGTEWASPTAHLGGIAGDVVTTPSVPPIQITPAIPRTLITPAIPRKLLIRATKICVFGKCVTTPAVYSPAIPAVYSPAIPAVFTPAIPGVTIDTRTGAKIDVSTEGKVGLQQTVKADAGSVEAKVIFDATLQAPEQVQALRLFSLDNQATLLGDSTFSTNFPQLSAKTEFVIGVKADLGAQACLIGTGCLQGKTTIGFDPQSIELISFNENGNGRIRLLGLDALGPADFNFGDPIGITGPTGANVGSVTVHVPNLQTEGTLGVGGVLHSNGAADFLELKADLDGIAQTAAGLPPILGSSIELEIVKGLELVFSYDLLDIEFGPIFEVIQTFELDSVLMVDFAFSEAVLVEGFDAALDFLSVPFADIPRMALGINQTVEVTPTYWVDAMLRNTTQLGVDGEFTLDVLKASFALEALGLSLDLGSLGPLFKFVERFGIADFPPLFDQQFKLAGFDPFVGDSFVLASLATDPLAEPAPLQNAVAVLVTGSPVELSQEVARPDEAEFEFSFDYLFATDMGVLQVFLGLELITQIASTGIMQDFATFSTMLDAGLFGGLDTAMLRFWLDGPSGSTLLLDNVVFPGIVNGDFDLGSITGRLTGWQTWTDNEFGVVSVATFAAVPEPRSLPLFLAGLMLLALGVRRGVARRAAG